MIRLPLAFGTVAGREYKRRPDSFFTYKACWLVAQWPVGISKGKRRHRPPSLMSWNTPWMIGPERPITNPFLDLPLTSFGNCAVPVKLFYISG